MESSAFLEWLLAIIGSGGLGAVFTYIATFKSKKKQVEAEAEQQIVEVEQKRLDLRQDQYDYLQKTCDKYIKDYHELEGTFRKRLQELGEQITKITIENSKEISSKCAEIASLKSEISYLKGIRCYNFTCSKRIKQNPDKEENNVYRKISVSNS